MANARVNLDSVRTTGWVDIRDDNSSVSRGNIAGNLQLSSAAKILNSYIGGDVISTSMPRLTNCDLQRALPAAEACKIRESLVMSQRSMHYAWF